MGPTTYHSGNSERKTSEEYSKKKKKGLKTGEATLSLSNSRKGGGTDDEHRPCPAYCGPSTKKHLQAESGIGRDNEGGMSISSLKPEEERVRPIKGREVACLRPPCSKGVSKRRNGELS